MTTIEDEIRATANAWNRALIANDAEAIASFMTGDWVFVGPNGVTPKTELIGWIASGRLAHHSLETVGAERFAIHGDTVLVTGRGRSTGSWEGVAYATDDWTTDVFVRQDGRWLCALSHKAAT